MRATFLYGADDVRVTFDRTVSLEQTPDGGAAMDDRTAPKVMVRP
ncbi:hypothetical protein [Humibacillus xanthopallidus]|nr:hypothetical protein [Humibacillus xanthopallidus]